MSETVDNAGTVLGSLPYNLFITNTFDVLKFLQSVLAAQSWVMRDFSSAVADGKTLLDEVPEELLFPVLVSATEEPHRIVRSIREHYQLLLELLYCRCVDNYLLYIAELLALIFRTRPEMLKSKDQVSVETVLEYSTMEEFLNFVMEKKVTTLSFMGLAALNEYLQDKLSFSIFGDNEQLLERMERIIENRNLFVHNRGIVNRIYLKRVPNSQLRIGERLILFESGEALSTLNADYLWVKLAAQVADRIAAEKFGIPRTESVKLKID